MPKKKLHKGQMSSNPKSPMGKGQPATRKDDKRHNSKFVKPGRNPAFSSPEELKQRADEYFAWTDANPYQQVKIFPNGKRTTKGIVPVMKAYTLYDFWDFCGVSEYWYYNFKSNKKLCTDAFLQVLREIETKIRANQVRGALSGFFKENLVARLNGISDKLQQEHTGEIITKITGMEIK